MHFAEMVENTNFSFMLVPLTQSHLEMVNEFLPNFVFLSQTIGIKTEGHILSKVITGKRQLFEFLLGFEYPVWISILVSLLFISITFSFISKSFVSFMRNLWELSFVILSEPMQNLPKH